MGAFTWSTIIPHASGSSIELILRWSKDVQGMVCIRKSRTEMNRISYRLSSLLYRFLYLLEIIPFFDRIKHRDGTLNLNRKSMKKQEQYRKVMKNDETSEKNNRAHASYILLPSLTSFWILFDFSYFLIH